MPQFITIKVPVTGNTTHIHVATTTGRKEINVKSPESAVRRFTFDRNQDGAFALRDAPATPDMQSTKAIPV